MPELSLPLIAIFGPLPLNHWLERELPRRRGEIRPSTMWLAIGATLFVLAALLAVRSNDVAGFGFLAAMTALGGIASIVYFCHRRVIFGNRGVYEWRMGRLSNFCAYKDIHRCKIGADIASRALEIENRYGRSLAAPGFVNQRQLEEAIQRLHRARVRLPEARELKTRLGVDIDNIL
ncbi:MAG: hypothetical protein AAFR41_10685 [Pseudomonadota bacterium]